VEPCNDYGHFSHWGFDISLLCPLCTLNSSNFNCILNLSRPLLSPFQSSMPIIQPRSQPSVCCSVPRSDVGRRMEDRHSFEHECEWLHDWLVSSFRSAWPPVTVVSVVSYGFIWGMQSHVSLVVSPSKLQNLTSVCSPLSPSWWLPSTNLLPDGKSYNTACSYWVSSEKMYTVGTWSHINRGTLYRWCTFFTSELCNCEAVRFTRIWLTVFLLNNVFFMRLALFKAGVLKAARENL